MKRAPLLVLATALAATFNLAGCASAEADTQARHEERTYVTGSNIAHKQQAGEVSVMSGDEYQRARSNVTPPMPTMPGGAH